MNHKGNHVFLDFTNFYDDDVDNSGEYIFNLMKDSINNLTKMKIMHSKLVILKDDTEEGFTSVLLLDESHISAHSYTKLGLLALDIFTCGNTDPEIVALYIIDNIKIKYPKINCVNYIKNKRFIN